MKKGLFLGLFLVIFSFILTNDTRANVQGVDRLCEDKITYFSSNFHFLNDYPNLEDNTHSRIDEDYGCYPLEFLFSNRLYYASPAKRIKVVIGNFIFGDTLIDTELSPYAMLSDVKVDGKIKTVTVYRCPTTPQTEPCPFTFHYYDHTNYLGKYNGAAFKIYLDNTLVREYRMKFISGNSIQYNNSIFISNPILITIPIVALGGITILIIRRVIITNKFHFFLKVKNKKR